MEIRENEVYTAEETQRLLKISSSTLMRMIKGGLLRAGRAGRQYRILGKEILRAVSPKLEDKVGMRYNKGRHWVHEGINEPQENQETRGEENVKR